MPAFVFYSAANLICPRLCSSGEFPVQDSCARRKSHHALLYLGNLQMHKCNLPKQLLKWDSQIFQKSERSPGETHQSKFKYCYIWNPCSQSNHWTCSKLTLPTERAPQHLLLTASNTMGNSGSPLDQKGGKALVVCLTQSLALCCRQSMPPFTLQRSTERTNLLQLLADRDFTGLFIPIACVIQHCVTLVGYNFK